MNAPIDWLLDGEAWVAYRTRCDLLGQPSNEPHVQAARAAMLADQGVQELVSELSAWPGTVIASHKSAGQPFHKLTFLADLGLRKGDQGVDTIAASILAHTSSEGPFQLPMTIPVNDGGIGQEHWAWALCDAPLSLYALLKFGYKDHPSVQAACHYLADLVQENGWPCKVSKELGTFRGPGSKNDPCPFANLAMLKALSETGEPQYDHVCQIGTNTLLELWQHSKTRHPYMFFMGNDFRKLKSPLVWYDLLHVLDVLVRFPWLRGDERLADMLELLKSKMDSQGRFTVESLWTAWKSWEFGQKKTPSRWLTFLAWRIIQKMEHAR